MTDIFSVPTYIVINLPSDIAQRVRNIRRVVDPERADLPVEITVAGSGGLGIVASGQRPLTVFAELARIAAKLVPFEAKFNGVKQFPGTGIWYLEPEPLTPFNKIQMLLSGSSIKFEPSPFPFTPHCTIRLKKGDDRAVLNVLQPRMSFEINNLSVYQLESDTEVKIIHRVNLTGGSK